MTETMLADFDAHAAEVVKYYTHPKLQRFLAVRIMCGCSPDHAGFEDDNIDVLLHRATHGHLYGPDQWQFHEAACWLAAMQIRDGTLTNNSLFEYAMHTLEGVIEPPTKPKGRQTDPDFTFILHASRQTYSLKNKYDLKMFRNAATKPGGTACDYMAEAIGRHGKFVTPEKINDAVKHYTRQLKKMGKK